MKPYQAAKKHNRLIVGYISQRGSAGAAGGCSRRRTQRSLFKLRSGYAKLPRSAWDSFTHYFTGADNVLEMTIVTADGNHIISNAYRNSDLFWALRGGGGGTWGVVTSVTYKTHPSTPFSTASFSVNSTNTNSTRNLLTEIIRLTPSLVMEAMVADLSMGSS